MNHSVKLPWSKGDRYAVREQAFKGTWLGSPCTAYFDKWLPEEVSIAEMLEQIEKHGNTLLLRSYGVFENHRFKDWKKS